MAGQHLAVRVDVDPLAFGLLEQFVEVFQVVAGDADALAADRRDADAGRLGMAVGAGVGGIQQAHHRQVQLARLHRPAEQFVGGRVLLGEEIERLVERGIDLRVFVAEDSGVIGIGGGALQSVEDQFLQAGHVVAQLHLPLGERQFFALADQPVEIGGRLPGGGPGERLGRLAGLAQADSYSALALSRIVAASSKMPLEPLGIEIDVGHRGEQEFEHRAIDLAVAAPSSAARWAYIEMPLAA